MIQFDKDGVTLIGYDSNGNRFSHNYMEGDDYSTMLGTRAAQLAAASANVQTQASYKNLLDQYQQNYGRPGCPPLPVKPQQKVVDDLGGVTFVPFVPALPDFVPPNVVPSGSIKADVPDKQAIMYNMILAMFRKEFPEA